MFMMAGRYSPAVHRDHGFGEILPSQDEWLACLELQPVFRAVWALGADVNRRHLSPSSSSKAMSLSIKKLTIERMPSSSLAYTTIEKKMSSPRGS